MFQYLPYTLFLLFCNVVSSHTKHLEKLLIVSYDGFRFNYLNESYTPNLYNLLPNSSYAKFIMNVFPTQTFPNHFTISTGLYTEIHGVLGSHVWDDKAKKELEYGYELWHYNQNIIPIWTLNEKAGKNRHSGVMMWPGSDFDYNGTNTTFIELFDNKMDFKLRVDKVMKWFTDSKTPANLALLYFEEPDQDSHVYGPTSEHVRLQIQKLDNITKYILDSLKKNGLDDLNIIFLSDHGMDEVTRDHIVNLTKIVGDKTDMYGTSPVLQIYPKEGENLDDVFKTLENFATKKKTFNVYKKADIPEYFYYKNCGRTPPILALAKPGYAFQDLFSKIDDYVNCCNVSENGPFGVHGYDPKIVQMHPFFIAYGPLFKRNYTVHKEVQNVDLYSFFSHILDLELPLLVKPNGTINNLIDVFANESQESNIISYTVMADIDADLNSLEEMTCPTFPQSFVEETCMTSQKLY